MGYELAMEILLALYQEKYEDDTFDYNTVDDYYAYLGYDLELTSQLADLGIQGTSHLQMCLENTYENL